jgi:hypothetical protein
MRVIDQNGTMTDTTDKDEAPAPEESREALFRALVQQHAEGRVALTFDFKRLNHMDCPVAVEADGNIIAYAVLALTILALWLGGWWAAGATLAAGAAFYLTIGRRFVRGRIRRRIEEQALGNRELWQKLWRFGGIALVPTDDGTPCRAPEGNWMGLVRQLRAAAPKHS